jgi:hypothetical protein
VLQLQGRRLVSGHNSHKRGVGNLHTMMLRCVLHCLEQHASLT